MNRTPAKGFAHPRRVEDATRLFFDSLKPKANATETVQVQTALGRVLARAVIARKYLPASDVAIVDGYAVRSTDIRRATMSHPKELRLVGESKLGESCRLRVRRGEAVAVSTGSSMPKGADGVVMVERATRLNGDRVEFRAPINLWQGITRRGEDISPGKMVLNRGSRLRPEDIGALKALALEKVTVVKKSRVGVLSTGNELVDSSKRAGGGKIVDLNRPILSAMLQEAGAEVVDLGIARDDKRTISAALKTGLARTDMVLVTAGSSVGRRDLVPECINRLGKPGIIVHGVAMRPAMPTGLAVVKGKPIVSLPGFPVSAMIAFRVFVRPLLAKLVGAASPLDPNVTAVLKKRITGTPGHRTFVRVRVKKGRSGYVAVPLKTQRSSQLTSMVHANGIVTLLESIQSVRAGSEVLVSLTGEVSG